LRQDNDAVCELDHAQRVAHWNYAPSAGQILMVSSDDDELSDFPSEYVSHNVPTLAPEDHRDALDFFEAEATPESQIPSVVFNELK